ncbi:MAG: hypothetical protein ACXWKG_04810 [Limisphaerales bacterium]
MPQIRFHSSLLASATAALLLTTGCINLPPQVKVSVEETRTAVAQLHKAHAQNARALERLTSLREQDLRAYRQSVATALRLQLQAQLDATKTRILADYDHQSGEVLGIQFQKIAQQHILAKFEPIEQKTLRALIDAERQHIAFPNDPGAFTKCVGTTRDFEDVQTKRDSSVIALFLTYEAALKKARYAFASDIEAKCNEKLQDFIEKNIVDVSVATPSDDTLAQRFSGQLADLDDAYLSVDHSLSDLSTFLDSEAMTSRFVSHAVKGFGQGLFDELTANNGAGAIDVVSLFGSKGQALAKVLQGVETDMHKQATDTIIQAKDVVDPSAAVTQQAAATTTTTQNE